MENTNQPTPEKGFFEKNKNFLVLLLLLVVVIGLSVTILLTQISSNYAQPATVINTQVPSKDTKAVVVADVVSQSIKDGKGKLYPITDAFRIQLKKTTEAYIKSLSNNQPIPAETWVYLCTGTNGTESVYETQIPPSPPDGTSLTTPTHTCELIGYYE
jgi:hypothetical protein